MKILEKKYDPIIGSYVITRYEKPLYYLDFNDILESSIDENTPKKWQIYVIKTKMTEFY